MNDDGLVIPEQEPEPTRKAVKEATDIASGSLKRFEAIQTHIHWAGIFIFWMLVLIVTASTLVWSWHFIAPDKWRFLSMEQQSDLQKMLLAAVGSSAATQLSRKWLEPSRPNPVDSN